MAVLKRTAAEEMPSGSTLFDTAIGRCGIAWGRGGIRGIQLPEQSEAATRAQIARRGLSGCERLPPPEARQAIDAIVALLNGERTELGAVRLDWDGVAPFRRKVYEAVRTIPAGSTLTYGEVAARLNVPGSARAVGQALGRNPFPLVVPCHRVVAASGLGGFSATGGVTTKLWLLSLEGFTPTGPPKTHAVSRQDLDPAVALEHLRSADPVFGPLIDRAGPFDLGVRETSSTFGALAEAIVYQQLSPKAAGTIYARLCAKLAPDGGHLEPEQILASAEGEPRSVGLSRAKEFAVRDLANKTLDGTLPGLVELRGLGDEEVVDRLVQVRGVGRWTAEMFLIFRFGRLDVLPVSDYGLRRGFQVALKRQSIPEPDEVARRGKRWAPYRSVASWYLWRAAEQPR